MLIDYANMPYCATPTMDTTKLSETLAKVGESATQCISQKSIIILLTFGILNHIQD